MAELWQTQLGARLQAEPLSAAGIDLQNVFDRPVTDIAWASGDSARRDLGMDFLQATGTVEVKQVQWNIGIFHPERGGRRLWLNKQHAMIRRQLGAKHQALLSFLESLCNFDMEAGSVDPDIGFTGGLAIPAEAATQYDCHRYRQATQAVKERKEKLGWHESIPLKRQAGRQITRRRRGRQPSEMKKEAPGKRL